MKQQTVVKSYEEFLNEDFINLFADVPQAGDVVESAEVTIYGVGTIRFKSGKKVSFATTEKPKQSSTLPNFVPGYSPTDTPDV